MLRQLVRPTSNAEGAARNRHEHEIDASAAPRAIYRAHDDILHYAPITCTMHRTDDCGTSAVQRIVRGDPGLERRRMRTGGPELTS